jgi:hypothetical protein
MAADGCWKRTQTGDVLTAPRARGMRNGRASEVVARPIVRSVLGRVDSNHRGRSSGGGKNWRSSRPVWSARAQVMALTSLRPQSFRPASFKARNCTASTDGGRSKPSAIGLCARTDVAVVDAALATDRRWTHFTRRTRRTRFQERECVSLNGPFVRDQMARFLSSVLRGSVPRSPSGER